MRQTPISPHLVLSTSGTGTRMGGASCTFGKPLFKPCSLSSSSRVQCLQKLASFFLRYAEVDALSPYLISRLSKQTRMGAPRWKPKKESGEIEPCRAEVHKGLWRSQKIGTPRGRRSKRNPWRSKKLNVRMTDAQKGPLHLR